MRFKPPPLRSNIGWRVEFRVMEVEVKNMHALLSACLSISVCQSLSLSLSQVQVTEFENAAFAVFIVLLTRTILSFKLNFLVPISKVRHIHLFVILPYIQMEENMKRSITRDAVHREFFYFRKTIFSDSMEDEQETSTHDDKEYTLMNTDTIFNGNVRQIITMIFL